MRLWVFLLALFALSATILAQSYEGDEESSIADSDVGSNDQELPLEEIPEGDEEEIGEELETPVGATEDLHDDDVTPVDENDDANVPSEIPADADEAHVEDSEAKGATEEQLLANENVGQEIEINEAQAEEIEAEDDWGASQSESQKNTTKPEWKTFPLYSGSIDVERDCGCKIKWMKKIYNRPKCKPRFYHSHKSVGFHHHHHHHPIRKNCHHRRVVPFPRRAHVHHIVRHHVHHKKPCGCLKKTVIKNVVVHHRKQPKPCNGKHHGHGRQWRFGRNHY